MWEGVEDKFTVPAGKENTLEMAVQSDPFHGEVVPLYFIHHAQPLFRVLEAVFVIEYEIFYFLWEVHFCN